MRRVIAAGRAAISSASGAQADYKWAEPRLRWSYSGDEGPEHWADLDDSYRLCREGKAQSPVDLKWSKPRAGLLKFSYANSPLRIIDTGYSIQVNFDSGSAVVIRGKKYDLLQVHFHSPSEHTISSRSYPMEAHLVHERGMGEVAVIGVMFVEGCESDVIEQIWSRIPEEKNREVVYESETINPMSLIPVVHSRYYYIGSLTTPPCTEGVIWNVLNTPLQVSRGQIEAFCTLYPGSNRPVQPLNGRKIMNH